MNNVLAYLEWRGDLSFSQSGFNEVDNLILSLLSYFDFKEMLPAPGEGEISVEQACQVYFHDRDMPAPPDEPANSGRTLQWLLYAMAQCRRYQRYRAEPLNQSEMTGFLMLLGDFLHFSDFCPSNK